MAYICVLEKECNASSGVENKYATKARVLELGKLIRTDSVHEYTNLQIVAKRDVIDKASFIYTNITIGDTELIDRNDDVVTGDLLASDSGAYRARALASYMKIPILEFLDGSSTLNGSAELIEEYIYSINSISVSNLDKNITPRTLLGTLIPRAELDEFTMLQGDAIDVYQEANELTEDYSDITIHKFEYNDGKKLTKTAELYPVTLQYTQQLTKTWTSGATDDEIITEISNINFTSSESWVSVNLYGELQTQVNSGDERDSTITVTINNGGKTVSKTITVTLKSAWGYKWYDTTTTFDYHNGGMGVFFNNRFIIIDSSNKIYVSEDGTNFTKYLPTDSRNGLTFDQMIWRYTTNNFSKNTNPAVLFVANNKIYLYMSSGTLALGANANPTYVFTSTNGLDWTYEDVIKGYTVAGALVNITAERSYSNITTSGYGKSFYNWRPVYCNGTYVWSNGGVIYHSTDLINWYRVNFKYNISNYNILFTTGEKFYLYENPSSGTGKYIYSSTDGITWTTVATNANNDNSLDLCLIIYINGKFIGIGKNYVNSSTNTETISYIRGHGIYISTDCVNWTCVKKLTPSQCLSTANFGNAILGDDTIITSGYWYVTMPARPSVFSEDEGETWNDVYEGEVSINYNSYLYRLNSYDLIYGNGIFIQIVNGGLNNKPNVLTTKKPATTIVDPVDPEPTDPDPDEPDNPTESYTVTFYKRSTDGTSWVQAKKITGDSTTRVSAPLDSSIDDCNVLSTTKFAFNKAWTTSDAWSTSSGNSTATKATLITKCTLNISYYAKYYKSTLKSEVVYSNPSSITLESRTINGTLNVSTAGDLRGSIKLQSITCSGLNYTPTSTTKTASGTLYIIKDKEYQWYDEFVASDTSSSSAGCKFYTCTLCASSTITNSTLKNLLDAYNFDINIYANDSSGYHGIGTIVIGTYQPSIVFNAEIGYHTTNNTTAEKDAVESLIKNAGGLPVQFTASYAWYYYKNRETVSYWT